MTPTITVSVKALKRLLKRCCKDGTRLGFEVLPFKYVTGPCPHCAEIRKAVEASEGK